MIANASRFDEAVRKAIAAVPAGKEGKDGPSRAASLLPEYRGKQPRTFPSVRPAQPRVVFAWPRTEASAEQRKTIDALAGRVVRLGHSSSLVTVRLLEEGAKATWVPDQTGEVRGPDDETVLRVVEPGQLGALDAAFAHQADEPGRVIAGFPTLCRPTGATEERTPTPSLDDGLDRASARGRPTPALGAGGRCRADRTRGPPEGIRRRSARDSFRASGSGRA